MEISCKKEKITLIKMMAQEFLEDRLGIEPTAENVRRFTAHVLLFEKQLTKNKLKKQKKALKKTIAKSKCRFEENIEGYSLEYRGA